MQLLGGYIASLLIYAMWKPEIDGYEALLRAGGLEAEIFTNTGPGGIFALFPPDGRSNGTLFINEFVATVGIAMVIWSQLDSTNVFTVPSAAPYTIGLAFAVAIWGFSTGGLAGELIRRKRADSIRHGIDDLPPLPFSFSLSSQHCS